MLTELRGRRVIKSRMLPSKIVGIGLNYPGHEMPVKKPKAEPLFFLKPTSAIIHDQGFIVLPPMSKEVHYEIELAVIMRCKTRYVKKEEALRYVYGYSIMIDVTAYDLQRQAVQNGLPYALSKGFDTFAPLYHILPKRKISDPQNLEMSLSVNGQLRQKCNTKDMIFKIDQVISYLSKIMTLERGDVISTGTPTGVGPLHSGDVVTAKISQIGTLTVRVTSARTFRTAS